MTKTTSTTTTTVVRTNRRSTKEISAIVEAADRMAVLAREASQLKRLIEELTPTVLEQIGDRREVLIDNKIRILEPTVSASCSIVDPEALLAEAERRGLKIKEQPPRIVAPATARQMRIEGIVGDDLVKLTETPAVSIV